MNAEDRHIVCKFCGKVAERVYLRAPGFNGKSKGIYPYFDVQLGCTLESSQHRDRVAKKRGLAIMGKEEFDRSRHASRTPNPMDSDEPDPELIETAKRAWDDLKYHRVDEKALVAEVGRTVDFSKEADVLDVGVKASSS